LIWGTADAYLGPALADDSAALYPGLQVEKWDGVGHWVQQAEPDRLNRRLEAFLSS
jgi:pimeloyl-ACP methyl ester carboxylesterase